MICCDKLLYRYGYLNDVATRRLYVERYSIHNEFVYSIGCRVIEVTDYIRVCICREQMAGVKVQVLRYYVFLQLRNTANKIHTDKDGEKANPSVVETHRAAAIARLRSIILVSCLTSAV